eukprot:4286374-Lingulodinium_polyedra.AAC.1
MCRAHAARARAGSRGSTQTPSLKTSAGPPSRGGNGGGQRKSQPRATSTNASNAGSTGQSP